MNNTSATPTSQLSKTIWRIFLIIMGVAFIFSIFSYVKTVLLMLLIAWLISVILNPLVDYLESIGFNRALAILTIMAIILGGIIALIIGIIPTVIKAVESISATLKSDLISNLTIQLEQFFQEKFNNPDLARDLINKAEQIGGALLVEVAGFLKNAGTYVAFVGIVPIITFFLIKDRRLFKRALISQVPNRYFELFLNVLHKVDSQVTKYIQGQAIDALIVGLLSIIGLFIINLVFDNPVPYFFVIGMIAGVANLIPYLGPYVGAVPAIVLTILNNPDNVGYIIFWVIVVFVLVQLIDNNLVSPMVVSKSVNMHPITVVIAVIIGGNIAGMFGMLFAVPFWGIIKVTMREVSWGLRSYKLK